MASPFSLTLANPAGPLGLSARLFGPIRFLAILIWPLALFTCFASLQNWYDMTGQLDTLLKDISFLQGFVVGMLTANLLSRLVLGITMAHYGIPPQRFGIRLLVGVLPKFFVNTGPIRHLDFSDQCTCYAAPLLTRLSLFIIGILVWLTMERSGSGIAEAALVIGATGFGSFLFTANPMWRADGYHWMAAALRQPNLREQSYRLLGLLLQFRRPPSSLSARAIWGLILYAVVSIIFTAVLIFIILVTVATTLEAQYRGTGVALFALMLSMILLYFLSLASRQKNRQMEKANANAGGATDTKVIDQSWYQRWSAAFSGGDDADDEWNGDAGKMRQVPLTARRAGSEAARDDVATASDNRVLDVFEEGETSPPASAAEGSKPSDASRQKPSRSAERSAKRGRAERVGAGPNAPITADSDLDDLLNPTEVLSPGGDALNALDSLLAPESANAGAEDPTNPVGAHPHVAQTKTPKLSPESRITRTATAKVELGDGVKQIDRPALDSVLKVGKAKPSRTRQIAGKIFWIAILLLLIFVAMLPYQFTVGGDFSMQALQRTEVRARTGGEVIEMRITEGDEVAKGDILAVLSNWDEERDIALFKADLVRLRAELDTLTSGPRQEEVELAEQELVSAETRLQSAKRLLERNERLHETGTVSQRLLEDAQNNHRLALVGHEKAALALRLLKAPARESEVEAGKAKIERIEQQLVFSERQLEHTNVRALTDGLVVLPPNNMSIGTYLREGDLFANIVNNTVILAEIEIPETEIDEATVGAKVILKPWSAPNANIEGTVKRVAPVAEEREFGQVVRVVVEVPNSNGRLAPNMTGYGKILVDERPVWQVFTRVFVRFFLIEIWSWVP